MCTIRKSKNIRKDINRGKIEVRSQTIKEDQTEGKTKESRYSIDNNFDNLRSEINVIKSQDLKDK